MLKNIIISCYGKINLKILKEKLIKSIRIKAHLSVPTMYRWGTKFLRNEKINHFKGTCEKKVQF
jgi:hypothetical protein